MEAATVNVTWCEACDIQMPEGKFCGECGSGLTQKEIEAPKQAPKKSGGYVGTFGDEQRKKAQQDASNPVGKTYNQKPTTAYVGSFGDETRRKAQQAASTTGGYNKFGGGGGGGGYVGTFGDEQRRKAQQDASTTKGYNKFGGGGGGGGTYTGTFGDDQRKKAQQDASTTGGYNKFGGAKPAGYCGTFGDDQRKAAQQNASTPVKTIHESKPAAGYVGTFGDDNRKKAQQMTNEAGRQKSDIVMSNEKKCEGVIDLQTANAIAQQKESQVHVPRGSEKGVVGIAPAAQVVAAEPQYRCESCDEGRPQGKFCQECGGPLSVC